MPSKKRRAFLGLFLFLVVVALVVGCSHPGASSTPPSNSQAQSMNEAVIAAVGAAFSGSGSPALSIMGTKNKYSGLYIPRTSFSYNGGTYSISGSDNQSGSCCTYPETFTLTITFNGYTADGVTFNSGSATLTMNATDANDFTLTYVGNFNITYQATAYTFAWNIDVTDSSSTIAYTGNFTIDGETYDFA